MSISRWELFTQTHPFLHSWAPGTPLVLKECSKSVSAWCAFFVCVCVCVCVCSRGKRNRNAGKRLKRHDRRVREEKGKRGEREREEREKKE